MKPRVFIGSSRESVDVALAVQEELEESPVEVTVWTQSIFELSKHTLESLVLALNRFDFGIFIFGADDIVRLRGFEYPSARDNVVFELGLFIGKLGRERSFLLVPKGHDDFHLPTDLLGITFATFDPRREDKNLRSAVAPACRKIQKLTEQEGPVMAEGETREARYRLNGQTNVSDQLITGILHTVCRAVALPHTPGAAKIRAFLFRKEDEYLVCSHYWAQHPAKELVGKLRFEITPEEAKRVAVVRCCLEEEITRAEVSILPDVPGSMRSQVSDELRFVLAAPVFNADGSVWGIVDFDVSTPAAQALLSEEVAKAAIFQLAQYLQLIISVH